MTVTRACVTVIYGKGVTSCREPPMAGSRDLPGHGSSHRTGPIFPFRETRAGIEGRLSIDSTTAPGPSRPPTGLHRTQFRKEKKKSDFSNFSGSRFFSIASTIRGQSSVRWQEDVLSQDYGKKGYQKAY